MIERPASVVKELVENSLDAEATRIEIEIRAGGRHLIRVTDNGMGMDRDDAVLSLERHATSKLWTPDDITTLTSLGFRGEALASISAVSRFSMTSVPRGETVGTIVEAEGGVIKRVRDAGAAPGTTVTVEDIFYNVPPRLKYLKAIPSEASHIADIVGKLAMSRPDVSFRLQHGDFEVLFTPGNGDQEAAIAAVIGREAAKDLLAVGNERDVVRVRGFIGRPENARSNRGSQYFFVNGRSVRSPLAGAALEKAYHTLLPIARFPLAVIFIDLPGNEVDINVHPAKAEVRFHVDDAVFRAVFHAVNQGLRENSLIPSWQETREPHAPAAPAGQGVSVPGGPSPSQPSLLEYHPEPSARLAREEVAATLLVRDQEDASQTGAPVCLGGVLDETYFFASDGNGVLIVDQHAAHERVLFERFMALHDGPLNSQCLVVSETVELNYRQYRVIADRPSLFEGLGYQLEPFGGKSVVIRAVPVLPGKVDCRGLLIDLIDQFLSLETFRNPHELRESFVVTMSCRSAVKAHDRLTPAEHQTLLSDLWRTQNPYTCPHGRPTMIRLSRDEMDRRFRRR